MQVLAVTASAQTMSQRDLFYASLRRTPEPSPPPLVAAQSSSNVAVVPHARNNPRRSLLLVDNIKLTARIEERLREQAASGCTKKRSSVIREVVLECRPSLRNDPAALKKELNRCRMLVSRNRGGGISAKEKMRISQTAIGKSKRACQMQKRRREAPPEKLTAKTTLDHALYQWAIDQLHMGSRLNTQSMIGQATLIINDLRVQHQVDIENGEIDAGTQLRLPQLEGNAGRTWVSRFLHRKGLSWRMTNLQFKIDKATQDARIKVFLERVLHIRWLHYYLNGERQLLDFSNSDEKPMMMIQAASKKTIAIKGKRSRVWAKEPHVKTRARFTVKTRVTYPKAPADGKTVSIMFKGEGSRIAKTLEVPDDALLQWGPFGSFRMDTNRDYYKWIVPKCPGPTRQTLYLADWAGFNINDPDLHNFFDEQGHFFDVMGGCITCRVQPCDLRTHAPFGAAYCAEEVADGNMALLHGAAVVPAERQDCIDRVMHAWRSLPHAEYALGFLDAGIANDLFGDDDDRMSTDIATFWKDNGMDKRRADIGAWVKEQVDNGSLTSWLQYRDILPQYAAHDPQEEGQECIVWVGVDGEDDDLKSLAALAVPEPPIAATAAVDTAGASAALVLTPAATADASLVPFPPVDTAALSSDLGLAPVATADALALATAAVSSASSSKDPPVAPVATADALLVPYAAVETADASLAPPAASDAPASGISLNGVICHAVLDDVQDSAGAPPIHAVVDEAWSARDETSLKATVAALEACVNSGGDQYLEMAIRQRMKSLRQRKGEVGNPGAAYVRQQQAIRNHRHEQARKETQTRRHELAQMALKQKEQQQVIEMAKLRNTSDKVALKAKEQDMKVAKAKMLESKDKEAQAESLRIQTLATTVCERIAAWHQDDPERFNTLLFTIRKVMKKEEAVKIKKLSKWICPTFYTFEKRLFVNVAVPRAGAKPPLPIWCTAAFRHFVFGGKSQVLLLEPEPAHNLSKLLERMLPGYASILPYEYHIGPLLRTHGQCLDLAFLEAVWRYSRKIGDKRFPCGDFTEPVSMVSSVLPPGVAVSSSSSSKPE